MVGDTMSPKSRLLWLGATAALVAGTSWVVSRRSHDHGDSGQNFHWWMHEQLEVTPDQERAMAPAEMEFESERSRLRGEISAAGRELADAVRSENAGSTAIQAALVRLNSAQAELQRATIEHFFAMKSHLDPAQSEKLLQWTHDSLLPD